MENSHCSALLKSQHWGSLICESQVPLRDPVAGNKVNPKEQDVRIDFGCHIHSHVPVHANTNFTEV